MARPLRHGLHGRPVRHASWAAAGPALAACGRRRQPLRHRRADARRPDPSGDEPARAQLGCDVWLVHLTGEEFPADCLGARALDPAPGRGHAAAAPADRQDAGPVGGADPRALRLGHDRPQQRPRPRRLPDLAGHRPRVVLAGRAGAHRHRRLERVGPRVEPDARTGPAGRGAGAARTGRRSPRSPRSCRCRGQVRRRPTRGARSTTPTARSSPTPACRACCSWRTTTSTAPATTTRTTRWRSSTWTTGRRWRHHHRVGGPGRRRSNRAGPAGVRSRAVLVVGKAGPEPEAGARAAGPPPSPSLPLRRRRAGRHHSESGTKEGRHDPRACRPPLAPAPGWTRSAGRSPRWPRPTPPS